MNFTMRRLISSTYWQFPLVFCLLIIVSSGCSKQEETSEQHLSKANDYFAAEQYDKAIKEYREALRLAPNDPVALGQLGIIYHDQGQNPQAYPLLKKAAELQPDNPEVQLHFGLTLLSLHKFKDARAPALRVLNKQPGREQALMLLTGTAVRPEDIAEVRKLIENFREKDQDRSGYHLALGALALRENDQASAEIEFKAALELDPKSGGAYTALGALYWSRNELDAAKQAFKTAADLAPPRSPMRLRYADFLLKTGSTSEAEAILQEITRRAPDYLPAHVYLMKLACTEHRKMDCAARVEKILSQDPINYDALFQDGVLSLAEGDGAKAVREYEFLSKNYSKNPQVQYQLALAYLLSAKNAGVESGRKAAEAAEKKLNEAIKLDPKFDQATLLLAELKIRGGVPSAAVDLLTPVTEDRPQIAAAHYLLASAYLAQQQSTQALAVYRRMTELFPDDPQPPFLIGKLLLEQRQQPQARKAFEKSTSISPDYVPAVEDLVNLDIADKHFADAIDRVQKLIDKNPTLAHPWAIRGKIYLAQRDFTHAEQDLLKAIELSPQLEPAYRLLAQLYVLSNRQEQAIEKLTAYLETTKTDSSLKSVPALMQLGLINEGLKRFAAARDAYDKVLSVAPNFGPALNNLSILYSKHLARLDKAYELAKRARAAGPSDPHIADTLGWVLYKKGEYDAALPLLQEAVGKLAGQPEVQFHVGMAHYMLGQEEAARLALQRAAQASAEFPGKDEARRRLALLAIDAANANSAARAELNEYLQQSPNDPVALLRLARAREQDGAVSQAIKTYEKVVDGNPLFAPAIRRLAVLYAQQSVNVPKAYELAVKARQAYPDDPEIGKTLGILNYRRGSYRESAEQLQAAAAKRTDDPELLYYLGEAYHQLKQWKECKEALQHALNLHLTSDLVSGAKRALADCSETSAPP